MVRDAKGITLIALAITIIVMLIILGVTTTTVMDSYKNTKIQNFAAEMRVIQAGVDKFYSEYFNWDENTENDFSIEEEDRTKIIDYLTHLGYVSVPNDDRIINGIKVKDMGTDLQEIIDEVSDKAEHSFTIADSNISSYYYLMPSDMENLLGLKNLKEHVIINFFTRNVISVTGIRTLENSLVYREYDLPKGQHLIEEVLADAGSITLHARRLLNTNDFVKVELYFEPEEELNKIGRIKNVYAYRISEEDYDDLVTQGLEDHKTIEEIEAGLRNSGRGRWINIEKFTYDLETKRVTLDLIDPGFYYFRAIDYVGNRARQYESEEYIYVAYYNHPVPPKEDNFIPVKFIPGSEVDKGINSGTYNDNEIYAVVCTTDDPDWYDYQPNRNSKWANIMILDGKYTRDTEAGKVHVDNGSVLDISSNYGSMYVWIPRYAYKVYDSETVSATFLKRYKFKSKRGFFSTSSL